MLGDPWEYLWVAQFASPFSGPESTVSGWRFRLKNAGEDAELPELPAAWAPHPLPACPASPARRVLPSSYTGSGSKPHLCVNLASYPKL